MMIFHFFSFPSISTIPVNLPDTVPVEDVYGFESDELNELLNIKLKKDHPFHSKVERFVLFPDLLETFLIQMSQGDETVRSVLFVIRSPFNQNFSHL